VPRDGVGALAFEGLQAGDYTLTPTLAGHTFTPTSRTVAVGATSVAGLDFVDAAIVAVTHWLTGTIGGTLVSGVRVDLGGAANGTTLTDAQGHYAFSGLADGVYTVTPTAQGGAFLPTSRQVTVAGADVTAVDFASTTANLTTFAVGGRPSQIVAGLDGNIWFTQPDAGQVVRYTR